MTLSSISFAFFSATDSSVAAVKPRDAVAAAPAAPAEKAERGHAVRRNVLYDAMMSALQSMGLVSQTNAADNVAEPAADAATPVPRSIPRQSGVAATGATTAATESNAVTRAPVADDGTKAESTASAPTIEDAVLKFANALGQALRGSSSNTVERGDDDAVQRMNQRRHHRHDHDRAVGGDGPRSYGGMAEKLETLAASVAAAPKAAAPAPAAATVAAVPDAPAVATPPVTSAVPVRTVAAPAETPISLTPPTEPAASVAKPASSNSLVDAFAGLLRALKSNSAAPTAPVKDAASQLGQFLHLLSQALKPSGTTSAHMHAGILIDVMA